MGAHRRIGLIGFIIVMLLVAGCGLRDRFTPTANVSPCRNLDIKPDSQDFANSGGVGAFNVIVSRACSWNAVVENQAREWIEIKETTRNQVSFTVLPNTDGGERTGRIFVGAVSFLVRQGSTKAGKEAPAPKPEATPAPAPSPAPEGSAEPCQDMVLTPQSKSFDDRGGIDRIMVQAPEGCAWKDTIRSEVEWIDVRPGDNSVSFRVKPNTGDEARASVIHIGPKVFSVRQRGQGGSSDSPCKDLDISAGQKEFDHQGGAGSFDVMAPSDCYWQAQVDARSSAWIEIRTVDQSVKYRVAPNDDLKERQGTIIVGAKVFRITQAGRDQGITPPCNEVGVSPDRLQFEAGGGSKSVMVTTEGQCAWKAVVENYSREWLQAVTNGSVVEVSVKPNTGYPRRGRINIGSKALLVEQNGKTL